MARLSWLLLALGLLACSADGPWLVADWIGPGRVGLTPRPLPTLTDASILSGSAAELQVGGELALLRLDPQRHDPALQRALTFTRPAGRPALNFVPVESPDGTVAWLASDLAGLELISAYAHLEAAEGFFLTIGALPASPPRAYYRTRFTDALFFGLPQADNAFYLHALDALFLQPPGQLAGLPLPMNRGVIVHELSHRAFSALLFVRGLDRLSADAATDPELGRRLNRLRSLDEGLADYWAAVACDDPDWLGPTLPTEAAAARRLDSVRLLADEWRDGALPLDPRSGRFDPYGAGAVIAAALWAADQQLGALQTSTSAPAPSATPSPSALAVEVYAALRELGAQGEPPPYHYGDFLAALARRSALAERQVLCALLHERLAAAQERWLAACE